jgi:sugar phosphate isomerase/epimerase
LILSTIVQEGNLQSHIVVEDRIKMASRREFVKSVGLGALAGTGMSAVGLHLAAAAQVDRGLDKSSQARLLPGCCAYSYNNELRQGGMTLEDFILKAVEMRLVAVDMTVYYLKSTEPAYLYTLRQLAYKHGMAFSGAACGVSMVQANAAKRAESLKEIEKWIDATDQLGASHLRIFAGKVPAGSNQKEAIDGVVQCMKNACEYSGRKGITLGIENHDGISQSADVCLEIMQRVNSPYSGINLDITNFIATPARDAYAQITACIPYATNIHIRDRFYDGTPVDMERVWQIFARAGHQGYVSAEYEASFPDSLPAAAGVPKLVHEIQTLCKKYSSV